MNSDSIPNDLIMEIFSRLPAKSIARFHCVSKLWKSKLDRPDFRELFSTRSSAQPKYHIRNRKKGLWSIFSLPQPQRPYEKSSSSFLVASAEFHMKFPPENMRICPGDDRQFACGYALGLIYFYGMTTKKRYVEVPVVCNPKTGRYEALPYIKRYRKAYSFFGFDPIGKQFKVLCMAYPCGPRHHKIMTLGTGETKWRTIRCSLRHEKLSEGICINGVLYYLGDAAMSYKYKKFVIVCFDVRSEQFKFIFRKRFCKLINYKGKLGVVYYEKSDGDVMELRVCVLEDFEKNEWSKYAYTLRDDKFVDHNVSVAGVIATGEIVLSMASYTSKQPFYIFYCNPERNTLQRVEVKDFGDYHEASENPSRFYVYVDDSSRFYAYADQVEDLNVNDPKLLKSSIYAPFVQRKEKKKVYYEWSESEDEEDGDGPGEELEDTESEEDAESEGE